MTGTFVYGEVWQHKDLLEAWQQRNGYCKVHGGGWYLLDKERKTITLYGSSGIGKTSLLRAGVIPILRRKDYFPLYVRRTCGLALWHCLFRRAALAGLVFAEDIRRGADRLFTYEFLRRNPRMARVSAVLYGYRQRQGSIAHAALGAAAVEGYAKVMRRLVAEYRDDARLAVLRAGEFVFLTKYIVREYARHPESADLPICREIVGALLSEGVLRFRDFGWRWGWRLFRFARKPRTR